MQEDVPEGRLAQTVLITAQFASLEKARSFVGQAAKECGLDSAAIYAVQLAVDEACSNIIEHAYGGESQELIQCTCWIGEDRLTVILEDCGRPFNPLAVGKPDLTARVEERKEGGLGLYFIHELMDEVSFSFSKNVLNKPNCNMLTMVKRKEKPV